MIDFPSWVTTSKCEFSTLSRVAPQGSPFGSVHGAVRYTQSIKSRTMKAVVSRNTGKLIPV